MVLKEKEILFSVVVPIYGVEKYIHQCIDSILFQTYVNFELILVDDGSKDNCASICDQYASKDNRVSVIHKKNGGLVSARIEGTKCAKGKYIVAIDGDDWVDKDYLRSYANIIKQYEPDIICEGYIRKEDNNSMEFEISLRNGLYERDAIEKEIFQKLIQPANTEGFPPSVWAKAFKTELYKNVQLRIDECTTMGEDISCSIPCIVNSNRIYISNDKLYFYRINTDSMSNSKKIFHWDYPKLIYYNIANCIDLHQYDFDVQMNRRLTRELFLVAQSQFNQNRSYLEIKNSIIENLRDDLYAKAIKNARFKLGLSKIGIKYLLYSLALKHKMVRIIWIYNKLFN